VAAAESNHIVLFKKGWRTARHSSGRQFRHPVHTSSPTYPQASFLFFKQRNEAWGSLQNVNVAKQLNIMPVFFITPFMSIGKGALSWGLVKKHMAVCAQIFAITVNLL